MWVEVTWFYFPEELHCGRLAAHDEREVFESHTSDETELAAIVRKVKVLSKDEFDALPAAERKRPDTFFCRYHYDPNRRKFMPIIQSLKKASLGGLETFKAQGKDRLLAFPDVLGKHARTRSRTQAGLVTKILRNYYFYNILMHARTRSRTQAGLDEHNAEEEEEEDIHAEPQFANKFEKANYALQLSTVPSTMPCREVEQQDIRNVR
jgi:hypothetical protein